jgi:tyrosyl-tRNA synthetase
VHGTDAMHTAEQVSSALFGNVPLDQLDQKTIEMLTSVAPHCTVDIHDSIEDVLITSNLATSKRESRQFIDEGAVTLNGNTVKGSHTLTAGDFINGIAILKRGKRAVAVLIHTS